MPRVRIYTSPHCGDCRRAKRSLDERGVPFEEVKIEEVARAAEFVLAASRGRRRVPTLDVDGRVFDLSPLDASRLESELAATLPCVQTVRPAKDPAQAYFALRDSLPPSSAVFLLVGLTVAEAAAL